MKDLKLAFENFHRDNPHVYELFEKFSKQAIHSGKKHFGAGAVWERLRWEVMMDTTTDDPFKLNNNHRAYYARMFMEDYPDAKGFFRTRVVRS